MKASDRCIDLIKEFEGFASQPYTDAGGKNAWGYGHTQKKGERVPQSISESDATTLLCRDLEGCEAAVEQYVEASLTQAQFDALCSFVYNLGPARLLGSMLLKKLNAGDYDGAADQFPRWCRVGQNQVEGLLRRRLAEQLLFKT